MTPEEQRRIEEQMQKDFAWWEMKKKEIQPIIRRSVDRVCAAFKPRIDWLICSTAVNWLWNKEENLWLTYILKTEATKKEAEGNGLCTEIERLSREILSEEGYPADQLDHCKIYFVSDEYIMREGGYRAYFA